MVQAHLVAPLRGVGAPDNVALGHLQARLFKLTEGLVTVGGEKIQAQPVAAGVLHGQFKQAGWVRPHQVNPHLPSEARQFGLVPIHSGLGWFAGKQGWLLFAVANHRHTARAEGFIALLPADLQGEVLAFFPCGIAQQLH